MDVLITCKYKEDPIKNEGARVDTTLYSNFSDAQGQIVLVLVSVSSRNLTSIKGRNSVANLLKFELIQAFMHVLVTCKNEDDRFKNEGARVFTRFLPL